MDAPAAYAAIVADLAARGVVSAAMFGKPGLKAGRTAFGCLLGDAMAFKLGAGTPAHAAALALPGAVLFDPSGRDRPFKDWVQVPVAHADAWPGLAAAALDAVAG